MKHPISVSTKPAAGQSALAPKESKIRTALGLHPELAVERERELPLFEELLGLTDYVGEVGLDGSKPHRHTLDTQSGILMDILIMCARAGGKIVSLHSRDARGKLLDLLSMEPLAGKLILHWFTGSHREIARAAEMGCWFSVGPAMMSSERGRLAVSSIPKDRILPETDGPFGTVKGSYLYPWEAMDIASPLAALWGNSIAEVSQQLNNNFRELILDQKN